MRQFSRRAALYAAAAATTLAGTTGALAAGLPGLADPLASPTTSAQSAKGDVTSNDSFHIVYSAKRAKGAPETAATGTFTGELALGGTRVLAFSGPITCLYNKGTTTSFFYPVTSSDPAVVAMFGAGVYIYVGHDGKGRATSFSFLPAPASTTDGCYPLAPLVPATGKAVATGG